MPKNHTFALIFLLKCRHKDEKWIKIRHIMALNLGKAAGPPPDAGRLVRHGPGEP